ncbi:hypothetical protein A1351_08595 [Methylosinus sp. R-45379]|uniref:hypothetical protein n=1 Tax=Methylosinus sp. R-45379 TaxID=980563 RepID=UPI0007C926EF|nr:hypothetical protein [Methylosinus sp. R-45379]OAI30550.1 hypothetical protein A1351_08595 [Methylosinus sp. R-45379]
MTDTTLALFEKQFPTIAKMVADSENYRIEITHPLESLGIGAASTVIFKSKAGRGFGASWHLDKGELHGLRSRRYSSAAGDDDPANREWIRELERRLSLDGESRGEIARALRIRGKNHSQKSKMREGLARRAY